MEEYLRCHFSYCKLPLFSFINQYQQSTIEFMFFQVFRAVVVLGVSGVANALLVDPLVTSQSDETRYIFSL